MRGANMPTTTNEGIRNQYPRIDNAIPEGVKSKAVAAWTSVVESKMGVKIPTTSTFGKRVRVIPDST